MPDPTAQGGVSPRSASQTSQPSRTSTKTHDIAPSAAASGNTPDMSDDESVDSSPHEHGSPGKSESEGPPGGSSETHSMPLQKRRRVTRACDECRRKKIKNPAPQYIEALETRLQRAEALLRKFMPDVDLTDPNLDPAVQQEFRNREQARVQAMKIKMEAAKENGNQDAQIMSMIETIGQLDITDGGESDFHGISSGAVFLRRMKEHFQGLLGNDYRIPFLPRPSRPVGMFSLDSPRPNADSVWDISAVPNINELPPKEKVLKLCHYALNCATCLLRVVHAPSFYDSLDRLYDTSQESWGGEDRRFLGLLYSVMALGCMYNVTEDQPSNPPVTYKSAMEEGIKYYASARLIMQDVAECRDMTSLQGLVFMILFLQATSNISGCYAFLGIALRSALRMGLHRHLSHAKITPIEDETRRRVFHVVRHLDTYVSAILGFPLLLHDDDIDQPAPTEVDDEFITRTAILTPPPGTPSFFQAFNAHNKLMAILSKVVKHIYPLKGVEECVMNGDRPNATYMISYSQIKEIERELHEWYEQLPVHWRPNPDGHIEVIRVRTLLRFAYAHVQMMLYRPFLHYVSPRLTAGKKIDDRYYNCAAAAISISRNIVHIGIEIKKQAVLIGPYWFILYAEFFAILSLVFYVLENPDKPGSSEILADARAGRDVIASLAQRSLAADRITNALNPLFEQLPERLKKVTTRPVPTKKRSHPVPGSKTGTTPLPAHPRRQDSISQRRSDEMARPSTGAGRGGGPALGRGVSFDAMGLQQNNVAGANYGSNFHDILPADVLMVATGSDSSNASGTVHRQLQGLAPAQAPGTAVNPLYKLDAMMFPSSDPFAYPNQPLMESANSRQGRGGFHGGGGHGQDGMQFYIPNMYDDIEGQILGPVPPYLLQQSPIHAGLDPASQMYTSNLLTVQQEHGARQHHGHHGHNNHQQGQHPHAQQLGQHQERDVMDGVLADAGFQGDWEDILGHGPYR
ncbi:fungal-specific transcription factor domain-containing protein [Lasiosphaeria miniovina]|uniref:Fungal-specific transcription factor domain-containing protein n=1 Tax=Lasiosphaeria miniovina TaxID=1954250 RepID=A0AA40AVQ8_9PEZI|nr:fungal-specific transcription factor domain-containing protein [Lasiosphaeria miniovina]KAK0722851.1 fungal-specific transcription factor domain-containing protein [Lasiosphaeria miniovina]